MCATTCRTLSLPRPIPGSSCSYREADPVQIRPRGSDPTPAPEPSRTGAFFSEGRDSFVTLLRCNGSDSDPDHAVGQVDDVLTVAGVDVLTKNRGSCRALFATAEEVPATFGIDAITAITDLHSTRWEERVPWEKLLHGAALITCAHLLGRALVPAGRG